MSIIEDRLAYLEPLQLGRGSHPAPNNGLVNACVMEAVSYVAGAAARAALAPTTKGLQVSALLLLDRMIDVGKKASA